MITPEVATAIEEIRHAFPGHPVTTEEDGQGGAFVTVSELEMEPNSSRSDLLQFPCGVPISAF